VNADRVLGIGGAFLATGIVVGAMAAHALQRVLEPRQIDSLHTAVNYQLFNALGLLAIGLLMRQVTDLPVLRGVAWLLIVGITCFSGGIYIMLAGAPRFLGLVTPVGGVLLIAAWSWLAISLLRR